MSKYQFYCKPNTNRREFSFLVMGSETYLQEKKQLIEQGFEVEDDVIYAASDQEAVEKFRSNFIYASEEYTAASPEAGSFIFGKEIVFMLIRKIKGYFNKTNSSNDKK